MDFHAKKMPFSQPGKTQSEERGAASLLGCPLRRPKGKEIKRAYAALYDPAAGA